MGDPRKQWSIDKGSAEKGVDLLYDGYSIRVLPALRTNPKYTARYRQALQKNKGKMKGGGELSIEDDDKLLAEVYADSVIVGWTNVVDGNGKKIPFTRANVIALLTDVPLLFLDVRNSAEDIALFRADLTEDTIKN